MWRWSTLWWIVIIRWEWFFNLSFVFFLLTGTIAFLWSDVNVFNSVQLFKSKSKFSQDATTSCGITPIYTTLHVALLAKLGELLRKEVIVFYPSTQPFLAKLWGATNMVRWDNFYTAGCCSRTPHGILNRMTGRTGRADRNGCTLRGTTTRVVSVRCGCGKLKAIDRSRTS